MDCPYDAIALNPTRLESEVDVEVCPICAGIWLSEGEIAALQAAHIHDPVPEDEPIAFRAAYDLALEEKQKPGPCPICGEALEHREYAYTSQVLVDVCPRGHGYWLQRGELAALEQFFARQHDDAPAPGGLRELWGRLVMALGGTAG